MLVDNIPCFAQITFAGFQVVKNIDFFASLIALFAWFLAHLNWSHIGGLLEEIAFFLRKSRFRILFSNSLVIQGDRFFRILFDLSGACLSTQPRNISFHIRHTSLGSDRSDRSYLLLPWINNLVIVTGGQVCWQLLTLHSLCDRWKINTHLVRLLYTWRTLLG